MNKDFYLDNNEDELDADFSYELEQYLIALGNGTEANLKLSEEAYDFILDHFLNEKEFDQIIKVGELAISKFPFSPMVFSKYCDALIIVNQIDKAMALLEEKKHILDDFVVNFLYTRANIGLNNFADAKKYFALVKKHSPSNEDFFAFVYSLALSIIDLGYMKEALYYLHQLEEMDTTEFEHFNDIAFCYDKISKPKKSIKYYNLYLDSDPFNDVVWFNLGTVYAREQEYDKAILAFDYAIALNKNSDSSYFNKGIVMLNLQRYREALECFEKASEIDECSVQPLLGIADSYMNLQKLEDAKDAFKRVLKMDKKSIEAQIGFMCVVAIEDYKKGDKNKFLKRVKILGLKNPLWLRSILSFFPELENDIDFMNIMDDLCKDIDN